MRLVMHTRECTGPDPMDGKAMDNAGSAGGKSKGMLGASQVRMQLLWTPQWTRDHSLPRLHFGLYKG